MPKGTWTHRRAGSDPASEGACQPNPLVFRFCPLQRRNATAMAGDDLASMRTDLLSPCPMDTACGFKPSISVCRRTTSRSTGRPIVCSETSTGKYLASSLSTTPGYNIDQARSQVGCVAVGRAADEFLPNRSGRGNESLPQGLVISSTTGRLLTAARSERGDANHRTDGWRHSAVCREVPVR